MIFVFDDFELDTDQLELRHSGTAVAIEPKTYAFLLLLLENPDRVLTKDEIAEKVWDGRFVSDSAITSCLKHVRKALGDSGRNQKYIKTVHGQGIRFVAPVALKQSESANISATEIVIESDTPDPEKTIQQWPSIAVLPFSCRIDSTEYRTISESISYDIHVSVSRLRWLLVIARGTSFRFKQSNQDACAIGQLLNAQYVLDGSIDAASDQLRVSIELSDTRRGLVIWSDQVITAISALNEIRDEIVNRVLAALEIEISLYESRNTGSVAPAHLDAWSAYHTGIQHMYRFNKRDNQLAIEYLQRSVSLEPDFARAHAALSFTAYQSAFNRYATDRKTDVTNAHRYAEKSIELEPRDPLANYCMGRAHWLNNDVEQGLPWLDRSLEYNPSFAKGHYARNLGALLTGETRDIHQGSELATRISPFDPHLYGFLAIRVFPCIESDDYDAALLWSEKAANSPGALVIIDLMALASATLAGAEDRAQYWLDRARQRRENVSRDYFFKALPFRPGKVREQISAAFAKHNL